MAHGGFAMREVNDSIPTRRDGRSHSECQLGDRMKEYESVEAGRRFMPLLPVMARVDGRAFHTFTRGMKKPFDTVLIHCMEMTAKFLAEETVACMSYTQSDEISLAWYSEAHESQIWFDGRIMKMVSQLGALATLKFNEEVLDHMPQLRDRRPTFDTRVWQVPTLCEGANVFVWREWDATKNSIQALAQSVFSPKELHGKNGKQQLDMLLSKGIIWDSYPDNIKRGAYFQRHKIERPFTMEEIDKLPPKHQARNNPNLTVVRSEVARLEMPPIDKVVNRVEVIFRGAEPVEDK